MEEAKVKRKYTMKEGVKYGRPKKIPCNNLPKPSEECENKVNSEAILNKENNLS